MRSTQLQHRIRPTIRVGRDLLSLLIIIVACTVTLPVCQGQPQQKSAPVIDYTPQTEDFKSANDALRETLQAMRHLIVRYHTSDSLAIDKEVLQQQRELLMKGSEISQQWLSAAIAEYRDAPSERQSLGDLLLKVLERNTEDDRYLGMLELAQVLLANGYDSQELNLMVAKAAFGSDDLELFEQYVAKLIAGGMELAPEYQLIYLNIELVKSSWEREQAAREEDAQGEPLPRVLIKTTKGNIEVELFENQAPEAVANFIHLIEQDFYNNLAFHRVLKHFMAQGGCPLGDGTGGPEYCIRNEAARPDARHFFSGTLGVALSNHPDSGGSQFFITFVPTPQLNGNYTAFGRVISGWDALANLARIDPEKKEEGQPPPIPDEIIEIEILSKRDHSYEPNKIDPKTLSKQLTGPN